MFSSESDHKAALVERFNRTIKDLLYRYFTSHNTKRWIDILQDKVYAYNHRENRTIGCAPSDVQTKDDERRIWKRVYYDSKEARLRLGNNARYRLQAKISNDEQVLLSRWKGHFDKGYAPNWSRERYVVKAVEPRQRGVRRRPLYKIVDLQGETIKGSVYPEELQPVPQNVPQVVQIESVLRKKRNKGVNETLVKFLGWPTKFNRWLTDAALEQFNKSPFEQQTENVGR